MKKHHRKILTAHFFKLLLIFGFISSAAMADSVMDRIDKTQTIRCGYVQYHPAIYSDLQSGKLKGYMVDIVEEMGKRLSLKIDWAYESNWPLLATDTQSGKFDVGCVGYWSNPRISKKMLMSIPLYYQPVFFFARADDDRFDANLNVLNDPSIKVSILDGDAPETILRDLYPQATKAALPSNASFAQVFQDVATKRADVTIASLPDAQTFMASNPNILKQIKTAPVRIFPSTLLIDGKEIQLKHMMDTVILEMQLDGTVERLIAPYMHDRDDFYFASHPYTMRTHRQKAE